MVSYTELCDSIVTILKDASATIGVKETSIIEGNGNVAPPSINVYVDPKESDENESSRVGAVKAEIDILCTVTGKSDATTKREVVKLAGKALNALEAAKFQYEFGRAEFAETNSDFTSLALIIYSDFDLRKVD